MSKNLIVIGVTGVGRNIAEIVEEIGDEWNLLGYLDDDPGKQGSEINDVPVLGRIADIAKYDGCYFIVATGTFNKKRIVTKLGMDMRNYATIIHPTARVSKSATIGKGSVIFPGVKIMANADIGNHVCIESQVTMGVDTTIRDYVLVSYSATIAGAGGTIEEGCWIGLNSSIRNGIRIGEWSIIGMGSVVVCDVPPHHVVAGNPAKVLRKLEPAELIRIS